jgi:hypothetical protein
MKNHSKIYSETSFKASQKASVSTRFNILCLAALMGAAIPAIAEQNSDAAAKLAEFRSSPAMAGALIYRGTVSALNRSTPETLYTYERRAEKNAQGSLAAHLTSDLQGDVLIVEAAQSSPSYELQRFDAINKQLGYSGSVVVSANGHRLDYHLNDNGKVSTASEEISDPPVSGPQMFGLILNNWPLLKAGKTLPVRMIVLKAKTTYGFDIRLEKEVDGQATFTVIPSSFLIRMAIAPMRVVFDVPSSTVVRYEGRVPPMESVAGKFKDLDARVDYRSIETTYR